MSRLIIFVLFVFSSVFACASEESDHDDIIRYSAIVTDVQRSVNLEQDEYYFEVTLDNKHKLRIPATMEDVFNQRIYKEMFFSVDEAFIETYPGYSNYNFTSDDGVFELKKTDRSDHSHWMPDPSMEIITIVKKSEQRYGESAWKYTISRLEFSDGAVLHHNSEGKSFNDNYNFYRFSKDMHEEDNFYKVTPQKNGKPTILVNIVTGKVYNIEEHVNGVFNEVSLKITW